MPTRPFRLVAFLLVATMAGLWTSSAGARPQESMLTQRPDLSFHAPQKDRAARSDALEGETVVRVLLVGDSWSEFMWVNRTLRDVFTANGYPDIEEDGSSTTESGSTAAFWAMPTQLQTISDALTAQPTIDVVQLTLGGNDLLAGQSGGGWYLDMPAQEYQDLVDQILADASTVLDHILGLDPEIRILLSLYDYPNFVDSQFFPGCSSTWNDLGQPTPRQINDVGTDLEARVATLATARPRVEFFSHSGLMQFTYGFPDLKIPPGQLLPPGDLDLPSPMEAMFLQADCFHLRPAGYEALVQNLWQLFYAEHFTGLLFGDGFETGGFQGWHSATLP